MNAPGTFGQFVGQAIHQMLGEITLPQQQIFFNGG